MKNQKVLILGGAGFIGSHLVDKFVENDYIVTVIDGLLEETSSNIKNLHTSRKKIKFIESRIETVKNLNEIVSQNDLIIDCLGWSFHIQALKDPIKDLDLNVSSHLQLIQALNNNQEKTIIYLGSRGQYGNSKLKEITEETTQIPDDVQGIHKLTAEMYYRFFCKLYKFNVISLRFPNTFGPRQPTKGEDIGLSGLFIRNILTDNPVIIYGEKRKRNLLYVKDLVEIVFKISKKKLQGFNYFNISGKELLLEELAKKIISNVGKGSYLVKKLPEDIKIIDIGNAKVSQKKLTQLIGKIPQTNLDYTLQQTIEYFKISPK